MNYSFIFLILLVLGCSTETPSQLLGEHESDAVFDVNTVHDIRITLPQESVDTLRQQINMYVPRVNVVGEISFDGMTRTMTTALRGSHGSFRKFDDKPGFKIKFDQKLLGLKNLNLHNSVQDKSFMSSYFFYRLFRAENQPAKRVGWATVTVNDVYFGLYTIEDNVDKAFLSRWFANPEGNLYKCNVSPSASGPCDFDNAAKWEKETNEDDLTRPELDNIAELLATTPSSQLRSEIEPLFDLTNFRTLWALENIGGHWDGYIRFVENNNYYVYMNPETRKFSMISSGADQTWQEVDRPKLTVNSVVAPYLQGDVNEDDSVEALTKQILNRQWNSQELLHEIDRVQTMLEPVLANQPVDVDNFEDFQHRANRMRWTATERPKVISRWDCTNEATLAMDYSDSYYHYFTGDNPNSGWELPGFNDNSWPIAQGSIGRGNDCRLQASTPWTSGNFAYVRLKFNLPSIESLCSVKVLFMFDDSIEEAYINGHSAVPSPYSWGGCAEKNTAAFLPDLNLLHEGENTLAVKVRNYDGDAYYDHAISYR